MKLIILILFLNTLVVASSMRILDVKKLDTLSIMELSALAYDDKTLYALSDKGYLVKFKLKIKDKKIKTLKPFNVAKLRGKKGKSLKKKKSDSEGMVYVDSKLLVSFERKPRLAYFSLDAKKIDKVKMNKQLYDAKKYRAKNKMLEAVAFNYKYGVLTAPELPLKQFNECRHTLYTKKMTFALRACGNITALEFINDDELLVLFRDSKLAIINLVNSKVLKIDATKKFKDYKFEGLSKLDENLYLMVSDNDDSIFQKTLFVLFEILD